MQAWQAAARRKWAHLPSTYYASTLPTSPLPPASTTSFTLRTAWEVATIIPTVQMRKQNWVTPLATWPNIKCLNPATLASTCHHVT